MIQISKAIMANKLWVQIICCVLGVALGDLKDTKWIKDVLLTLKMYIVQETESSIRSY